MTEHDDSLSLDLVTAALRADSTDVAIYARVLTQLLGEALPPDCVTVERDRTMADKMRGRPGEVSKIVVRLGDQQMTLGVKGGQPVAEICRSVRGVVLSRNTVPIAEWAAALASALVTYAEQNAQTAAALRKLVAAAEPQARGLAWRARVTRGRSYGYRWAIRTALHLLQVFRNLDGRWLRRNAFLTLSASTA